MLNFGHSTIAQVLFADVNSFDFARIVSELEAVLARLRGDEVKIAWDCDDMVTFDIPDTRILLAWTEVDERGLGCCLTVSVGPGPRSGPLSGPLSGPGSGDTKHDVLCSRLVERIQSRSDADAVFWCQIDGAVGPDCVDDLIDSLPNLNGALPPVESIMDVVWRTDLQIATKKRMAAPAAHPMTIVPAHKAADKPMHKAEPPDSRLAANDQPHLPLQLTPELARLRAALYPPNVNTEQVVYSTQMRLAAHCLNATLILVWMPLGAAVMTYSLVKGENMRLSSRLMAVTGTLLALAQSPAGHTMAAFAKNIV